MAENLHLSPALTSHANPVRVIGQIQRHIRQRGRVGLVVGKFYLMAHFASCVLMAPGLADIRADIEFLAATSMLIWELTKTEAEDVEERIMARLKAAGIDSGSES